jgi:DNA-binding NarL/FixJ family response regulator
MEKFLTGHDRALLRTNHKYERDKRVADRMKTVLLLDQGWTVQKIAEALMIDEDTVNRHLHEYQENGKLKPENGGSKGKLDGGK